MQKKKTTKIYQVATSRGNPCEQVLPEYNWMKLTLLGQSQVNDRNGQDLLSHSLNKVLKQVWL